MPIFIRGSGGGSSAKLEGDRYVSPSTSGAVKVTPNSGYDGFKRIFVYGYNTYDVTGTDADDADVLEGETYWSKYDSIRTGTMPTISIPAPTITHSVDSAAKKVSITASYDISGSGYNGSSMAKSTTITTDIPQETVTGPVFRTGTATQSSTTTTLAGTAYNAITGIANTVGNRTLKYLAASASYRVTSPYGERYISNMYYNASEKKMYVYGYFNDNDIMSEALTTDYLILGDGVGFDVNKYTLARNYRYMAIYE